MVKSQHEYNKASINRRGCKKIGIVVRKEDIDRFHLLKRESGLSVPDFFNNLLSSYQPVSLSTAEQAKAGAVQDTIGNEPLQEEYLDQGITSTTDAINLGMARAERNAYALALLNSHGGDKRAAMSELKAKLQEQYPGFSADRNKNRVGIFSDPMKFYSGVSDYLGRHLKSQQP